MAKAYVYLIHLDHPLAHAKHYLGYTAMEDVEDRLERHKRGNGARMLRACNHNRIEYQVVRVWPFDGEWSARDAKSFERKLKDRHNTPKLCPICNGGKRT